MTTSRLMRPPGLAGEMLTRLIAGGPARLARARIRSRSAVQPLLFPPGGVGLIWSAKSACTSSVLWFLAIAGVLEEAAAYDPWPHNFRANVLETSDRYRAWLATCDPRALAWVRVIRDPYKRAVSSFRHAVRYNYENKSIDRVMGTNVAEEGLSFDTFLDHLTRIDITSCNIHHLRQWHPLERSLQPARIVNADREPLLAVLLDFKSPADHLRPLLAAEIARIEGTHNARRRPIADDVSRVPFRAQAAAGEWPDYAAFLNVSTRRKIERIYAADFTAYADVL